MNIVINTCKGREQLCESLLNQLKEQGGENHNIVVNFDDFPPDDFFKSTSWANYVRAWGMFQEGAIHMDDDIEVTSNFFEKAKIFIELKPKSIIQFFSLRKNDAELGTRIMKGGSWGMQQAYYLPPGVGLELYRNSSAYKEKLKALGEKNIHWYSPSDIFMNEYFKSKKYDYLLVVPSLVQHKEVVSATDKRRSKKRISHTFLP